MTATVAASIWDGIDPEIIDVVREQRREAIWREQRQSTFEQSVTTIRGDAFQWNWHHRVMAKAIDRWLAGDWKRMMFFLPPDHTKTEFCGRLLPGIIAARFANVSNPPGIIYATHNESLAMRINNECQQYMESPGYRRLFPNCRLPGSEGKREQKYFCSSEQWDFLIKSGAIWRVGAKYRAIGVGGGLSGYDGHFTILDDLFPDREKAESEAYRRQVWTWLTSTVMRRLRKPHERLLLTMTRWHPDDCCGRILRQIKQFGNFDNWVILTFPAIMDEASRNDPIRQFMPFEDPRADGEALWDDGSEFAKDKDYLERVRLGMVRPGDSDHYVSPYDWNSLYQQRPMSEETRKIDPAWFQRMTMDEYRSLFATDNEEAKTA